MSHLESFDPKPALNEFAGQEIGKTPHKDVLTANFVKDNLRKRPKVNWMTTRRRQVPMSQAI